MRARVKEQPSNAPQVPGLLSSLCASESLFSRLTRWAVMHQVSQAEMRTLLGGTSLETPLLVAGPGVSGFEPIPEEPVKIALTMDGGSVHPEMLKPRPVLEKLAILLGMGRAEFMGAIGADTHNARQIVFSSSRELRFCRRCLLLGFHSVYFQYPGAMACPYHQCWLVRFCSGCLRPQEPTLRSVISSPMGCPHCGKMYVILNSALRDEERRSVMGLIGPMIENRMKEITPLPRQLFTQHQAWWWPTPWNPISQASAFPMQVRRWTLWNDTMAQCRNMHERQSQLDLNGPEEFDATPLARGASPDSSQSSTCWPVNRVTVERANEAMRWLSEACKSHVKSSLRVRGQMGMDPHGRCMNEAVDAVSVALHQTMITYGVQRNDVCFLESYDRDWPHPYHDVRWNHLQLSREGRYDGDIDAFLVEAEILSWFALALVRTAAARFTLEVVWPWHLNPWQFVPTYVVVRDGTAWKIRYRSRATRESLQRLIQHYDLRILEPVHDHVLRNVLYSLRPSRAVTLKNTS